MQRILSLATLAALGVLAWLFLRDGGLDKISLRPGGEGQSAESLGAGADLSNLFARSGGDDAGTTNASQVSTSNNRTTTGAAAGGDAIRIASFNIATFGQSKASNEAVMQTLAEIIRRFHVVAIQEVQSQDDFFIPNFLRQINRPGRRYDALVGARVGNTNPTEQFAFIFDDQRVECDFNTSYTIRDPENLLDREPLVASFRVRGVPVDRAFTFTLINVRTDPRAVAEELDVLAEVYRVVRLSGRNEDDVMMVGDFNVDDKSLGRLTQIPGMTPLIRGTTSDTRRTALYDNLVIHQSSTTEYVGRSDVFDFMRIFNLTQDNALSVSDHLPVYAEFSPYELDSAGRIASRVGPTRR